MLVSYLDYHRATVRLKCAGVPEADAHRAVLPSPLVTLAGLVTHLRWAEHYWFEAMMAGEKDRSPGTAADPDGDWRPPPGVPLADLLEEYEAACARSREIAAGLPLDHTASDDRRPATLRWVLVHMIEETARHNGHADVVREFLDGTTGE